MSDDEKTGKGGSVAGEFRSPFLDLERVRDSSTWRVDVPEHLCVGNPGHQFLFGGFTLAACTQALEEATDGEPVVNITCQFLSFAQPGQNLEFIPEFSGKGQVRQAMVEVRADGKPVARAMASVGSRRGTGAEHQFVTPFSAPPPQDCAERSVARRMSSNMQKLFEFRLVSGELPDSSEWTCTPVDSTRFWLRARAGKAASRPLLAMMGDFLANAIPGASGRAASGTSLDNTVRFVSPSAGQWVLCDARIQWIGNGFLHGQLTMQDEEGKLLAIASQSMLLRG